MNAAVIMRTAGGEQSYSGEFKSGRARNYLSFVDENGVKTTLLMQNGNIHISRAGEMINHSFTVQPGNTTTGRLGSGEFAVCGKRADYSFDDNGGELRLCYTLEDIASTPADFEIHILYSLT